MNQFRLWITLALFAHTYIAAAAPPMRFNYQGKLTDNAGVPLQGAHTLIFSLWAGGSTTVANSGAKVYEEQVALSLANGIANHAVGSGTGQVPGPLSKQMLQTSSDLFLQVAVDTASNVVLPRTRIESAPFAILSADGEVRTPISQPSSFPIVLDQPGSYYLTGNITGVSGQQGIMITTDGVSLDLSGFEVVGVPGSFNGVLALSSNVTIRNGSIRAWGNNGVWVGLFCGISDLNVRDNLSGGILTGDCCMVERCFSSSNGQIGISANSGSAVIDCVARDNDDGIVVICGIVDGCVVRLNGDYGILANNGSVVSGCLAESNQDDGIRLAGGSSAYGCSSRLNNGDGISIFGSASFVRDNNCYDHSAGAGIKVNSSTVDCRIEGNNLTDNLVGMDVDAAGNFISRNTCSGNDTNWTVVSGNVILVVNATVAGAVSGNSGGAAPGSTDPNANFTY